MLATGVDIIEVDRVAQAVRRWGERFVARVYTPAEVAYCRGRLPELAARFAAKEAVSKALGAGLWGKDCLWWSDIEVLPDAHGKPIVHLHGRAQALALELGLREMSISLSHSDANAVAFVVALGGSA